ncbi:MAG TPA: hypothetical protein VFF16_08810 [Telluria sp.]|nr:hypothetical protein [Telluria sp.]
MTMPLQFNKAEYIDILQRGGVAPDLALVHADAVEAGLQQHVVLPADLALLKAEIFARMDERFKEQEWRFDAKLRPIYVMLVLSLILHAITLTKLFF